MIIKIDKYLLEQEVNAPTKFNLSVEKVAGSEAKVPGSIRMENLAYGISIQHAIELIASQELLASDEVVTLREYVTRFNEQLKRFDTLIKTT